MRFFGLILVSVGFLGAVLSVSIGVIEALKRSARSHGQCCRYFRYPWRGGFHWRCGVFRRRHDLPALG